MGELEAIRRRHLLETADGNCAGSYSWDPEGWHRPQGHDLDLAVEDIGKLLAEVERLQEAPPPREWFVEVDSTCSLIAARYPSALPADIIRDLAAISASARRWAALGGEE